MSAADYLPTAEATEAAGSRLAQSCRGKAVIYLQGDLGAGKTSFARGFLRGLGYSGNVKSPTFTLVEPYFIGGRRIYHFDLYRLTDPSELDYLGIRDYLENESICLIEWPERGEGELPPADFWVKLEHLPAGRSLQVIKALK